jgi:hypothetical protein
VASGFDSAGYAVWCQSSVERGAVPWPLRQAFSLCAMHGTRVCPGREEVRDEMCSDDSPYPRSPNISLRSDPGTISTV